jgi:hypothetical protein
MRCVKDLPAYLLPASDAHTLGSSLATHIIAPFRKTSEKRAAKNPKYIRGRIESLREGK